MKINSIRNVNNQKDDGVNMKCGLKSALYVKIKEKMTAIAEIHLLSSFNYLIRLEINYRNIFFLFNNVNISKNS